MKHITTVCPYCGVGCVFDVGAGDGHARTVEYVPDHPVTEGALCPKGNAALEVVYRADRLRFPLLKQADGTFARIPWDEAIHSSHLRSEALVR